MHSVSADALPMAKRTRVPSKAPRALYIGQWIRATGSTPAEVARETKINEGYISQLISGQKKNPSGDKLFAIAECLKIPLGNLYKLPPSASILDQVADLDPEVVIRLSQKRPAKR